MNGPAAVALAALGSGLPSSVAAITRGANLLDSTRAAGTMLVGDTATPATRLAAGTAAHAVISTFWGGILWRSLPTKHTIVWGALAGLGIAVLDLGVVGRRFPAIRRLPLGPQLADHVAFGVIIAAARAGNHPPGTA